MAKVHLDRLKKKYPGIVSGQKYSEVVKDILFQNNQNVTNSMNRKSNKQWEKLSSKISTKEKRLVLPDLKEVVPDRALGVLKASQDGEMIRDTLRDSLTKDLRQTLDEFNITGQEAYIKRRGATAGRINPKLVKEYEKKIKGTFDNYTKKDPKLCYPENVHRIAVTEVRSAINNSKNLYTNKILEKNPDIMVKKKWIHNKGLSSKPRRGHLKMDGTTVGANEFFEVENWVLVKGRPKKVGVTKMKHPHDPDAPPEQVINCNCDYDVIVSRRKKK